MSVSQFSSLCCPEQAVTSLCATEKNKMTRNSRLWPQRSARLENIESLWLDNGKEKPCHYHLLITSQLPLWGMLIREKVTFL